MIDPATGALTTSVTAPYGVVTVAGDGSVTFTPAVGLAGSLAEVQYSVADTTGARSAPAALALVIGPAAADADVVTGYGEPVDVDLASSRIASGSVFTVTGAPANGSVTAESDGVLRYTPDAGFSGADRFAFRVCAPAPDQNLCDTGVVRVTVAAPAVVASTPGSTGSTSASVGSGERSRLADTGSDLLTPLVAVLASLLAGAALIVGRKRLPIAR